MPEAAPRFRRPLDWPLLASVFAGLTALRFLPLTSSLVTVLVTFTTLALFRRATALLRAGAEVAVFGYTSILAQRGWPSLLTLRPLADTDDYHTQAAYRLAAAWGALPDSIWRRLPDYESVRLTPLGNGDHPPLTLARTLALLWLLQSDETQLSSEQPPVADSILTGIPQTGGGTESIYLHDLLNECAHTLIHPNPITPNILDDIRN